MKRTISRKTKTRKEIRTWMEMTTKKKLCMLDSKK